MTAPIIIRRDRSISVVNRQSPFNVTVDKVGPRGSDGLQGSDAAGIRLTVDTTTTDSDPGGPGNWRANSTTFASITKLWIDNTQVGGGDITGWLDALDDGGTSVHRCVLHIELVSDATHWAEFDVTGSVVDKTGYRELTVAPRAQVNWPFTNGAAVIAGQSRTGVQGANGSDPGILFTWDTGTADADPGAGKIRANNASLASAATLYISKTNRTGDNIAATLAALDDSTNTSSKGLLVITSPVDDHQCTFIIGAVTDATNYIKLTVSGQAGTTSFAAGVGISFQPNRTGDAGATGSAGSNGIDGTSIMSRVRVVATANVVIASALENGDTLNGKTLATNDLVLLTGQTAPAENGVYTVVASGAASRTTAFNTYDSMPGCYFSVMEGTAYADTLWRCTSDKGGSLGTTALAFSQFGASFIGFSVDKNGTDQTGISDSTSTKVTWPREVYDVGGLFASDGWTPPAGNVALACGLITSCTITAGATIAAQLYKNGSIFKNVTEPSTPNQGSAVIAVEDIANGTDVYTMQVFQDVTASTVTVVGTTYQTWFMGHWIGP